MKEFLNFRVKVFDNMVCRSVPLYREVVAGAVHWTRAYYQPKTRIIDIGCSTGKLTKAMIEYNQDHCSKGRYIGIEIAEGFFKDLEKRADELDKYEVDFILDDIRNYEFTNCSLVTSIFTLQFMPKKDRLNVIKNVYNGLNDGGAFIFAEKTICQNALVQDMMDKERTLRHMMKPNTWKEIEDNLDKAGFSDAQPFWRNHAFVGALAIK